MHLKRKSSSTPEQTSRASCQAFGVTVEDFFDQDKRRTTSGEKSGQKGKGKSKDVPKGESMEQPSV